MTAETKDKTCEQRIGDHLEGRLEDIRAFALLDDGEGTAKQRRKAADTLGLDYDADKEALREAAIECMGEYPLAVSVKRILKVELSWGGPSDFFECEMDGREIVDVTYHFQDWFDGAKRALDGDDLDAAIRFCSYFAECAEE